MNSKFVNVKVFGLSISDWDNAKHCYAVFAGIFADKKVSVHSIRLDEIVDVDHHAYTMKLLPDARNCGADLQYHHIKVKTPSGQGINGISTDLKVSVASYKRICQALDVDADMSDLLDED